MRVRQPLLSFGGRPETPMTCHVTSLIFVSRHKERPFRRQSVGRRPSLLPRLTLCFLSLSFCLLLSTSAAVSTLVTLMSDTLSLSLKSPGAFLPPGTRGLAFLFLVRFPFCCTKSGLVSLEPSSSSLELVGLCSSAKAFLGTSGLESAPPSVLFLHHLLLLVALFSFLVVCQSPDSSLFVGVHMPEISCVSAFHV
jgi:hypothetical protein